MNNKKYLAMLSGGRDSAAMVELLLSTNKPVDYIIFTDTMLEFEIMYKYLSDFDAYLKKKYDRNITVLKPKDTFSDWVFGKVTRGERKGWIRGLPMLKDPCFWKRESKIKTVDKFVKDNNIEPIFYIGYTKSEIKRSQVKATNQEYPLIEANMCEADVDRLLSKIGLVNPLYQFFERTGCAICPYQSDRSLYTLMNEFPNEWDKMKWYESKLKEMENNGYNVVNPQWDDRRTLEELEIIFKHNRKNLSTTPPKSCECKIEVFNTQTKLEFDAVF